CDASASPRFSSACSPASSASPNVSASGPSHYFPAGALTTGIC
ncbi:MAG: hypothetical protein AVDCRST_MAG18-2136, partial [uncultured Thermomicrobiales bacterium]